MANQRDIDRWKKGKDHWNKWARGRLKAKEKLEKEGRWEVDIRGLSANHPTERWMKSAMVDFYLHTFDAAANFSEFIFPHEVNFSRAKFETFATFYGVIFLEDARFEDVGFDKGAIFNLAKFERDASFSSAVFHGDAEFGRVNFERDVSFNEALFYSDAWFGGTNFSGNSEYISAIFNEGAWFTGTSFENEAWFNEATFRDIATFNEVLFQGNTVFNHTEFQGISSFRSTISSGPFSLADAIFTNVPDFIQMSFNVPPHLDDIDVVPAKSFQRIGVKENTARYRALKKIAIESHDHVREQEFFASELSERRGNDDPPGSLRYILSFIYEFLSNFGRSLKRPLAGLLGTWLVMAAAYGTWVPAASRQGCGWNTTWLTPEHYLSLLHTFPFVGLVRSGRRELALKCLYGTETGFGAGTDVLFIAHNTFAAILIFLFFLAVRNHFKIK